MTNRDLINELKQQNRRVNAMKAKMAYRTIATELQQQIPEARILRTKPVDLLEAGIPDNPELLDAYTSNDMFYYHFVASLPDGRVIRVRLDSSLERFRIYRLYWLDIPRPQNHPHGYHREPHMSYDSIVCNRSNSNLKSVVHKLKLREPVPDGKAPTPRQLQEFLNDQYND